MWLQLLWCTCGWWYSAIINIWWKSLIAVYMGRFPIGNKADESFNEDLNNTHALNWHKSVAANLAKNYFLLLLF